ncbi:bactofilin family protein [Haloglomus litoreum]|uniref:bactofilin family protein n=1 Tax=Haloglomus litoreum TaxID=3034026 RepID=UPI0023E8678B|nr:polymer-forming cytoskeletal protein [Haloglomus sp. DT116]
MRQVLVAVLVLALVLPTFAGVASAESQRLGGAVVVEAGETVDGFTAYGGRVVVHGRVEGDLTAFGGRVVIAEGATVTGRVRAFAGSVVVAGSTGGNTVAYAGHVEVADSGRVGGSFAGVGGSVVLAGTVRDDATTVAGTVTLARSAEVDGFLTYVGEFDDRGGRVSLDARHVSDLSLLPPLTGAGGVLFTVYLLLADLLAGGLLLSLFPAFAGDAVETAGDQPQRVAAAGAGAVVGIPLAAALAALTVVGIPLALAALAGYVVLLWVGSIYGRYLLGAGLLSYTDRDDRYLALLVGVLVVAALSLIPLLGDLVRLLLLIAGLGSVTLGLYVAYESVVERRERQSTDVL